MEATPHRIPTALQIVAVLFLIAGIFAIINTGARLSAGSIYIDLDVFGIPIFFGLRRLSAGWRTFALIYLWFPLIGCPVLFLMGIFGDSPTSLEIYGQQLSRIPSIWISILSVPLFSLALWQYRVLTRPQIRTLFICDSRELRAA
ncbi:MAG: hypothetical protein ACO1QR_01830 [Chthoniobacteraceae bacterium]